MEKLAENRSGRILELDLLRGIAIILMVTGHSILVHPVDFTTVPWCQALHNWIYSFHMELFFFISGAVYHCSKYRTYILNKIDRLIVPMLFVGLLAVIGHSFGGDAVNEHYTLGTGLRGLFTGDAYWFLHVLFLISAIYPIIDWIGREFKGFEVLLAIVVVVSLHFVTYPPFFRFSTVIYYLPYFIVGHLLHDSLRSGLFGSAWQWQTVALFLSVIVYTTLLAAPVDIMVVRYAKAFAMMGTFYCLCRLFLKWYRKGDKVSATIYGFLALCSKYSLQLYLFNGFVLVVARTILVSKLHITNPALVIPLILAANLAVTLPVCKYVLEKTRWIGWLCGVKYRPWKS